MKPYLTLLQEIISAHNTVIFFDKESERPMWTLDISKQPELKSGMRSGTIQIIEGNMLPPIVSFDFIYENENSVELAAKEFCSSLISERLERFSKMVAV